MKLLQGSAGNTKLRKSEDEKYRIVGLSMAPNQTAGVGNVCPHSTSACRSTCLHYQGLSAVHGKMIHESRIKKTKLWYEQRSWFLQQLRMELEWHQRIAAKKGQTVVARLNIYSDVPFEKYGIIDDFPKVIFYDYTRNPKRAGMVRPNYHLTFSCDRKNFKTAMQLVHEGLNIATVFHPRVPNSWLGLKVIDGDESDLRFLDPTTKRGPGYVVGLKLKAHSKVMLQQAIDAGLTFVP